MKIYLQIIQDTWAEYMEYRLNFIFWRIRMVLQLLVTYFLWWAIFTGKQELFGYSEQRILTYILLSAIVRTIVLSTTTMEIGGLINSGNLSNYLIRPLSIFQYYVARDIGDKSLNFMFSIVEVTILFFLLHPAIFIQTNVMYLIFFLAACILGTILYFLINIILGMFGFWTPDVWSIRFIAFIIVDFLSGGLFPLDILPAPIYTLTRFLPFPYFLYYPLKIYLGQVPLSDIFPGFMVAVLWIGILSLAATGIWKKGLLVYSAEGK